MEPTTWSRAGLPFLVWRLDPPALVVSSAPVGGGLGRRDWIVNAQVPGGYDRVDLAAEVAACAGVAGVDRDGAGVGMLTAADVTDVERASEDGVDVWSTVGIAVPTWAAAPDGDRSPSPTPAPGTINVVVSLPVRLADAALVNAVATVAEAKAQALFELGVAGTGTATDAVCIVCPAGDGGGDRAVEPFGGPRSTWGARIARAVHASVVAAGPRSMARYA
jgi:adenosylcobinamide amidohydrolase